MPNQIDDPPNEYDFGLDFNYWQWTANTEITLTNVPWNNDYRDVVWFDTTSDLNAYIDEHDLENTKISNAMYAPVDRPIQIDLSYNLASRFNYVRVFNPGQSFSGSDVPRYLYYFITNTRYISTHNTELTVQLDVFQTFIRQVQFGRCYVERGHIGIANQAHFRNNGRDFLTVPEGIDVGSEYVNIGFRNNLILQAFNGQTYDILVCSTVQLEADAGDRNNPRLVSAKGSKFMGIPSGAAYYVFPGANEFLAFLRSMEQKPWVTQGIISISVIPKLSRYYPELSYSKNAIGSLTDLPGRIPNTVYREMWENWRYASELMNYIPERYRHLRKFWTSPYMMIEATTSTGTPIFLKPESWNSPHAAFREIPSLLPPEQRIVYSPAGYNSLREPNGDPASGGTSANYAYDRGDHLDLITQITNLPKLAIVNNGAILALAGSAHSIAYGYQSADWSQQRAMRGSQVAYDQAQSGIGASRALTEAGNQNLGNQLGIQQQLQRDNLLYTALGGSAMSGAAGLAAGPVGGATGLVGGLGGGLLSALTQGNSQRAANESLAGTVQNNVRVNDINAGQTNYVADTNRGLAQWAAKGDYENAIAGMNAKIQDTQLTPPSVAGQMGGEYLNLFSDNFGLNVRWKMIDQASIAVIGEYWLRYGYAVRRSSLLPANLMTMSKFTYWKLSETYIRQAPIPEGFKQIIRGIFEKGVTVWADPDYIGTTDWADNEIIPGIELDSYNPPVPPIESPIEPPVKKKKKVKRMLVFKTTDGEGDIWALAGTSPGTSANWIETRSPARALAFVEACNNDDAVSISVADFAVYKTNYTQTINADIVGNIGLSGPIPVTGVDGGPVIVENAP
jgi:hypothetical protein